MRSAEELAQGYTKTFRAVEILSIVAFTTLSAWVTARVAHVAPLYPWTVLSGFLVGWIGADFVSGLVHWMGDTWGTVDWPILGKAIIRPFREHHVDPKAMTRHDWIESIGSHCLVSLWVLAIAIWWPFPEGHKLPVFLVTAMASLTILTLLTGLIHKWAHLDEIPRGLRILQRAGLILSPEHHEFHHTAPYDRYYCITTGWLNPLLTRVGFYRRSERFITLVTGALPRRDDLGLVDVPGEPVQANQEGESQLAG